MTEKAGDEEALNALADNEEGGASGQPFEEKVRVTRTLTLTRTPTLTLTPTPILTPTLALTLALTLSRW